MATDNPTTGNVLDLQLLQRHVASLKDIRAQLGDMVGVINTRFGALEDALLRIERRLDPVEH